MIRSAIAAGKVFARYWKLVVTGVLLLAIALLRLSLADEQRHSTRLQLRLAETTAAFDRLQADVASKTELARARDQANAHRVERDQILISQETVSAYQKEIAALRTRAAQRLHGTAIAADPGGGGGAAVSGLSKPAGRADGAAGKDRLPDGDALMASEIGLRLQALQEWVRGQERVER